MDQLIRPYWPILDPCSHIDGISVNHLSKVRYTLRQAQAYLFGMIDSSTFIIGHELFRELKALRVHHRLVHSII
jgi:hypothetical protein